MTKAEQYKAVKTEAQAQADSTGRDFGIEWNSVFNYYRSFSLPQKKNRYGFELRCEVVYCTDLSKCAEGHGP